MKKILILGTALLCGFLGRVAAQGVEFRDLTFGQALEQAGQKTSWYLWIAIPAGADLVRIC